MLDIASLRSSDLLEDGSPTATDVSSSSPVSESARTIILSGVLCLTIDQLCELVKQEPELQNAEIVTTQTYAMRNSRIKHRFLLLEIYRPGKKTLWLRLDRRRDKKVTRAGLVSTAGTTDSCDQVSFMSIMVTTLKI